ncbi:hypothetical protein O181_060100 [Austropuccinia psidii MF-1]|uniref:Uncharacterized protein n=1 Tax=Austropuccinia psidii MF-1 TaxID=1389203 RepID=A0A9Q3EJS7_9BASI|nr:hypothetical protein [Austropuccinia psidii MF-1]
MSFSVLSRLQMTKKRRYNHRILLNESEKSLLATKLFRPSRSYLTEANKQLLTLPHHRGFSRNHRYLSQ